MDVHFNAYKARYELMENHIRQLRRSQYVQSIDIFINLDDVFHNMHRPNVNHEVQVAGIKAYLQLASHIINLIAHYKNWAHKMGMKSRVFAIYTTQTMWYSNSIYLPCYRDYFGVINDPSNQTYFFVNDAIKKAIPIAKNIGDYVEDVFLIDSHYLEPSMVPLLLKDRGTANYDWSMMVSRDTYDLQYAYRDKWIFVSPKGDNTRLINKGNMWEYIGQKEHVTNEKHNASFYHHDLLPMGISVAGNKYRNIPRLRRIGWKTIFNYLDEVTEKETSSISIITNRFADLLKSKGVSEESLANNMRCVSIEQQVHVANDIDWASITSQLQYVTDHKAIGTINQFYFEEFPINIPFLTAGSRAF